MAQGRKVGALWYGDGCCLHGHCETCPLPDCKSNYGANKKEQDVLKKRWEPYINMQLSEVATLGGKR